MTTPVINVAVLAAKIDNKEKVVVADCRFDPFNPEAGQAAYAQGHIPGAYYLNPEHDLSAPMGATGGRHPVPSPEDFTALMQNIGLDSDTLLVAYDGGGLAMASRLWWLARYFGHTNVAILDGGLAAWQAVEFPLETEVAAAGNGNFSACPDESMRVDFEELANASERPLLIDCRDADRYSGANEPVDPKGGHIPNAINMPYQQAIGENGLLRDPASLREYWAWLEKTGQQPIVYCGSGVTACVSLVSMELAGITGARLYPGSWSDWCQQNGPVATGTESNLQDQSPEPA